jgi:hypothetical protein
MWAVRIRLTLSKRGVGDWGIVDADWRADGQGSWGAAAVRHAKEKTMAAKIKQKTTFIASDGREFDTGEEVERYEVLKQAEEQLEEVVRSYNLAVARILKTADGYPFELGREYYIVWEHAYNEGISQQYFWPRETRVYNDGSRLPTVLWSGRASGDNKITEFYLDDIYTKERNAKLRLLEIRKKRYGWLAGDIAKMEKELGINSEIEQ